MLVDPEEHNAWVAEFEVDLGRSRESADPVLRPGKAGKLALTDLPLFPSKPSAVVCLRKPLYARPFRGLVSRRLLGFLRDNMGGFNFGSTSKISDCARG